MSCQVKTIQDYDFHGVAWKGSTGGQKSPPAAVIKNTNGSVLATPAMVTSQQSSVTRELSSSLCSESRVNNSYIRIIEVFRLVLYGHEAQYNLQSRSRSHACIYYILSCGYTTLHCIACIRARAPDQDLRDVEDIQPLQVRSQTLQY